MEAYVAIEYKTDQRGYIVKKRVVICDNKKFKKITMGIFNQVKTLKIATTEKNRYNLLPIQDTRFTNFNPFKSRCQDYRLWQQ